MRHEAEIREILDAGADLTLATLMADGAPHASTVSYASEGVSIFFGCAPTSQKASNLARDDRIAATIDLPYRDWSEIRGLAIQGRAERLPPGERMEAAGLLFLQKFSELAQYVQDPSAEIALFQIFPRSIAILDHRKGFGHVEYETLEA